MYNVLSKQIVLEIPKNGSRTLVKAATTGYGKLYLKAQGHKTLQELCDEVLTRSIPRKHQFDRPQVVVAVFRNPIDRFVSQIAHSMRNKARMTLDECMTAAWEQSDIVYKPQADFLALPQLGDWEFDFRFWPMERINQASGFVAGCATTAYQMNSGQYDYAALLDQMMQHRLYEAIVTERYNRDFRLWNGACRRGPDGCE